MMHCVSLWFSTAGLFWGMGYAHCPEKGGRLKKGWTRTTDKHKTTKCLPDSVMWYHMWNRQVRLEVASNNVSFWWSLGRGVTNSTSKLCNSLPQLILWQTGLHSDGEDYGIKGEGWSRVLTVWITISIPALCKFLPKFASTWKRDIRCELLET